MFFKLIGYGLVLCVIAVVAVGLYLAFKNPSANTVFYVLSFLGVLVLGFVGTKSLKGGA